MVSRLKGHDEVGLGTVLGSNVFNGLFITGVAATITPIKVPITSAAPAIIVGLGALALCFPPRSGRIGRWRGGLLVALYAVYLTAILERG
ncbi:MAG: hypothetical protein SFW09_19735 [Hyphomicrobiaceae bacterium]|nr:hypothetical protein [Hyphomicrobiaceae bacterium]